MYIGPWQEYRLAQALAQHRRLANAGSAIAGPWAGSSGGRSGSTTPQSVVSSSMYTTQSAPVRGPHTPSPQASPRGDPREAVAAYADLYNRLPGASAQAARRLSTPVHGGRRKGRPPKAPKRPPSSSTVHKDRVTQMRRLYGLDGAEDFSGRVAASPAPAPAPARSDALPPAVGTQPPPRRAGSEMDSADPLPGLPGLPPSLHAKLEASVGRGGAPMVSPSAARPPLAPLPSPSPAGRQQRNSLKVDLMAAAEPEDDLINWSQKLDVQGIDELRLSDSFSRFNF